MKIVITFVLLALALVGGAVVTLWSLDTLFPALAIPYTLKTIFAALVLLSIVFRPVSKGTP
jgi:hypothetical protein